MILLAKSLPPPDPNNAFYEGVEAARIRRPVVPLAYCKADAFSKSLLNAWTEGYNAGSTKDSHPVILHMGLKGLIEKINWHCVKFSIGELPDKEKGDDP